MIICYYCGKLPQGYKLDTRVVDNQIVQMHASCCKRFDKEKEPTAKEVKHERYVENPNET